MTATNQNSIFSLPITVAPADIDEQEHVSNVVIVDYLNRTTLAHSESLGFNAEAYRRIGGVFVVRRHEIDYKAMAFLGDDLEVSTWAELMHGPRAERRHRIVRRRDQRIIAEGRSFWTFVDLATGRPGRIPNELIEAFRPIAGSEDA